MKLDAVTGVTAEPRTFMPSPLLPTNDFVGIEVELEGFVQRGGLDFESDFWTVKDDPSLRQGKEFVYNQPLCGQDIITSLEEFETFIEWFENKYNDIDCSERTSVHIHLDVRAFTSRMLLNLGLLNMTFEPAHIKLFGPDRADSNYCLPMHKSADRFRMAQLSKDDSQSIMAGLQGSKYSSFNTLPIKEQGSVEFRLHTGTKSSKDILNWVCVILWMKKYARDMELDYLKYPEYVSEKGLDTFVREVFHDRAEQFLYQGFQNDLWDGIRVAQDTVIRHQLKEVHERAIDKDEINPAIAAFAEKNQGKEKPVKLDEVDMGIGAGKFRMGAGVNILPPRERHDPDEDHEWMPDEDDEDEDDGYEDDVYEDDEDDEVAEEIPMPAPVRPVPDFNGLILAAAGVRQRDLDILDEVMGEGEDNPFGVEI